MNEERRGESKKENVSSGERVRQLTSEEYFKGQKEIQLSLLKNEKALSKTSKILKNQRTLEGKITISVREMMRGNMDTFPTYEKSEFSHPAAIKDPRELVARHEEEWKEYNDHYRHEVAQTIEQISHFCRKWELDFNPYFREDVSAKTLWKELQKAYHAKMFEVQSGYEGEPNLNDM